MLIFGALFVIAIVEMASQKILLGDYSEGNKRMAELPSYIAAGATFMLVLIFSTVISFLMNVEFSILLIFAYPVSILAANAVCDLSRLPRVGDKLILFSTGLAALGIILNQFINGNSDVCRMIISMSLLLTVPRL